MATSEFFYAQESFHEKACKSTSVLNKFVHSFGTFGNAKLDLILNFGEIFCLIMKMAILS